MKYFKHDWSPEYPPMLYRMEKVCGMMEYWFRHVVTSEGHVWQKHLHAPNERLLTEISEEEAEKLVKKRVAEA